MKNFYTIIKLLLNVIIEKGLPPTFAARTLFILPSTISVGVKSIISNIKLTDSYDFKYTHVSLKISERKSNILVMYLSNKALELLNNDLESNLITKYLETHLITIDFIKPNILQNTINEMTYYYNERNKDGWKESNKQIPLQNTNYINVSEPCYPSEFVNMKEWCPLINQRMLGSQWGKVKGVISNKDKEDINKYLEHEFSLVDLKSECKKVLEQSLDLDDEKKIIAEFWAGIGGSVTPPGFFNMFLYGYFVSNPKPNLIQLEYFYKLSSGLFEASIIAWGAKYTYLQCRPIQSIRLNYPGIPIDYYFGETTTDLWKPYQETRLWTPPFPDFISGHSSFSSVAATILNELIGSNITNMNIKLNKEELLMLSPIFAHNDIECMDISDIIVQPESSKIQPNVPETYVVLSFSSWDEMASSAGISRIYGGIHYPSSNTIALNVGKMIGKKMLEK